MAIATLAVGAVSAISSLFGGGGADAKKYAERKARVVGGYAEAKNGNVQGYWVLGATGQVAPMPQTITFLGTTYQAGYTSRDWGSAYNPIVDDAARKYRELTPQFQNAAAQTLTSSLGGVTIPLATGAVASAIPGWVWVLGLAAILWLLVRKGR